MNEITEGKYLTIKGRCRIDSSGREHYQFEPKTVPKEWSELASLLESAKEHSLADLMQYTKNQGYRIDDFDFPFTFGKKNYQKSGLYRIHLDFYQYSKRRSRAENALTRI